MHLGDIWKHLQASGGTWTHLQASEKHLASNGSIWEALGSLWGHLEASGSICKVVKTINSSNCIVESKNDMKIPAYICGKMNHNYIRVIEGDEVIVKISKYDTYKGIIAFRKLKK